MHLYWPHLLDDNRVNRQWLLWLLSLIIFFAFLWHRVIRHPLSYQWSILPFQGKEGAEPPLLESIVIDSFFLLFETLIFNVYWFLLISFVRARFVLALLMIINVFFSASGLTETRFLKRHANQLPMIAWSYTLKNKSGFYYLKGLIGCPHRSIREAFE